MNPGGRQSPWVIAGIIAGVVGIVVLVAALVLALTLWSARSGVDENVADDPALELTSVQRSPESEQASEMSSPAATQDTETVTVTAEPAESRTQPGSPSETEPGPQSELGDGLACDGRGVLIISSAMGNSPTFRSEVDGAVAANPGAVLLEPGHCPSLRARVDGTTVHPVVVDYGDDREALCTAAAATPGSNARLLDGDTSYSSPC